LPNWAQCDVARKRTLDQGDQGENESEKHLSQRVSLVAADWPRRGTERHQGVLQRWMRTAWWPTSAEWVNDSAWSGVVQETTIIVFGRLTAASVWHWTVAKPKVNVARWLQESERLPQSRYRVAGHSAAKGWAGGWMFRKLVFREPGPSLRHVSLPEQSSKGQGPDCHPKIDSHVGRPWGTQDIFECGA